MMQRPQLILAAMAALLFSAAASAAELYFITPADGDITGSEVTVRFGLSGMGVAPVGVEREGTGHHHLLIDLEEMPDLSQPLPATEHIRHFGGGQTETTLHLEPGIHTLQLLLGDYAHVPFDPPLMSEKITIEVRGD